MGRTGLYPIISFRMCNENEFKISLKRATVSHLRVPQEHFADRVLSLPTEPKRLLSQAPVHSALSPVKLLPDQISNLHDS